ncbi:MAG: hypothetical protein IJU81_04200 [Bacteroidales bacterium]|nr:hypothetical protein [Bacteroidales bacterium]
MDNEQRGGSKSPTTDTSTRYFLLCVGTAAVLLLLSAWQTLQAQTVGSITDYLELIMEQSEGEVEADELLERLQYYADNPLNLNDTAALMKSDFMLLTEIQRHCIVAYIRQNGPLLSTGELRLVYGFDSTAVALLAPFVETSPVEPSLAQSLPTMLRHARHSLRLGGGRTVEEAAGYTDSTYLGTPWRSYFRYQLHYRDRINFSFAGEKDAGEEFFRGTQRQGFDHYGLSLVLRDFGRLRSLAVGRYQLQFGQGLTLWTGFAPYASSSSALCRNGHGIASASAFGEAGYMRGAATTVALTKRADLTVFYSDVMRDATITDNSLSLYTSGYHRSVNELAKRDTLRERLYGMHLGYTAGHFTAGLTAHHVSYSMPLMPAARPYNTYYFRGDANTNIGLDARWLMKNLCLFGEVAASADTALAAVAGLQYIPSSDHRMGVALRDYSMRYQNLFASATGQGSTPQNEQGLELMYEGCLPHGSTLQATVDFFAFPYYKYRVYQPSDGMACRLNYSRPISKRLHLAANYRFKNSDRNAVSDGSQMEHINQHHLYLCLKSASGESLHLTTRLQGAYVQRTVSGSCHGWMAYQDIVWQPTGRKWSLSLRGCWFDAQVYDARLYCYESSLLYESGSAMLYGKGVRAFALFRCDLSQRLAVAFRYTVTSYLDRDGISSGHDRIDAPHKQTIHMQLYWNI